MLLLPREGEGSFLEAEVPIFPVVSVRRLVDSLTVNEQWVIHHWEMVLGKWIEIPFWKPLHPVKQGEV